VKIFFIYLKGAEKIWKKGKNVNTSIYSLSFVCLKEQEKAPLINLFKAISRSRAAEK